MSFLLEIIMSKLSFQMVTVILDERSPLVGLYASLAQPQSFPGMVVFALDCSEAVSDGPYLNITLRSPVKFEGLKLRIPHQFVALIHDLLDFDKRLGFSV